MDPKDEGRMANSVDPDQTAPGSTLFAQTFLSENLGPLQYQFMVVQRFSFLLENVFLYSPQNGVLVGYNVFSMSIIPKFCQHLMILLYKFDSWCPILFKFTLHHNHQTMHVWQENQSWRVSITRVMPLRNSYNKMFVLWLIVHTYGVFNLAIFRRLHLINYGW